MHYVTVLSIQSFMSLGAYDTGEEVGDLGV
jgi:hypothetical protein